MITKTSPHTFSYIVWVANPYPKLHIENKSLTLKKIYKYIQPAYVLFSPQELNEQIDTALMSAR